MPDGIYDNIRLPNGNVGVGTIIWKNSVGVDWSEITLWNDNNLYLGFNTQYVSIRTDKQPRLNVDINGRVGIGITAPDANTRLHVYNTGATEARLESVAGYDQTLSLKGSAAIWKIYNSFANNGSLLFDRNGVLVLTLDANGNVFVGGRHAFNNLGQVLYV
jgi:hypothetical protein